MRYTFKKSEHLKSRAQIDRLFSEGKSLKSFPLRMVYLNLEYQAEAPFQAGFSVPKKKFKKAVNRNRIKRMMKEAYRLHKYRLFEKKRPEEYTKTTVLMFIYTHDMMPSYPQIETHTVALLQQLLNKITHDET